MVKDARYLDFFRLILAFMLFFSGAQTWGKSRCDTVYAQPERVAVYGNGADALLKYIRDELVPEVGRCMTREEDIIASLYVEVTISSKGVVIDAAFLRPSLSENCKKALKKKLLSMKGWLPALVNGQAVCSKFLIPVGCMKWQ